MLKILIISVITFMLVIIIFLIFMSFMNIDININSKLKKNENFYNQEPSITGGAVKYNDYYIFNSDGTITFNKETLCEVLIVGGGGGGARNDDWEGGGGGGGGGVGFGNIIFNNGTYNIKIGSGGAGGGIGGRLENGKNGENTTITGGLINEIAFGGGGGGWRPGLVGGSGGGGSGHAGNFSGGSASKGVSISDIFKTKMTYYGNNGGFGNNSSGGGGGGGADSRGLETTNGNYNAGNGGNGKEFNITGVKKYYGGGGGGASGCLGGCFKANGTISGNGGLGGGGTGGNRNNPTNGEANTGGGGGGSSKSNGANGGSGVVIIKINNINSTFESSINKIHLLFTNKKPWGMYFAEDCDFQYLKEANDNSKNAQISGNIQKKTESGNGASGNITYITGGTNTRINWPTGSIPTQFTILSLTRYTGGYRKRILSNDTNGGNFLHGHHEGKRGVCHYDRWVKGDPSIGNVDDWLCCIGKNSSSIPNNILIDGIPYGQAGNGNGGYKLCINNNPWNENSDWALSCIIIWDIHLDDTEMQLLNSMINTYKKNGKPLIDIIKNTANSGIYTENNENKQPLTVNQKFLKNNESFIYNVKYNSDLSFNNDIINVLKNNILYNYSINNKLTNFNNNRFNNGLFVGSDGGEKITFNFKTPFILKKIIFIANERNNAPAGWNIDINGNILSGVATSQDYDEFQGKSLNYCVVFYIDNNISSNTYNIIFTRTLGGTQLNFNTIILYEGTAPQVISTASSSIVRS